MTRTTYVKGHPRKLPEKPQVYKDKHEQLRAELQAINQFRDSFGYVRKPSESETLLRRSIRAFSEFVAQLGAR